MDTEPLVEEVELAEAESEEVDSADSFSEPEVYEDVPDTNGVVAGVDSVETDVESVDNEEEDAELQVTVPAPVPAPRRSARARQEPDWYGSWVRQQQVSSKQHVELPTPVPRRSKSTSQPPDQFSLLEVTLLKLLNS